MIEFDVLGLLRVRRQGVPVQLETTMLRRTLAVLLARVGDAASMDLLVDSLWLGAAPRTARKTVQIYIHRLRALLGHEELISRECGGYRLTVPTIAIDATRFEEEVQRARYARAAGDFGTARAQLRAALALWRGPALADFPDLAAAQSTIQRLTERHLVAWEEWAELDLALGRHADLAYDLRPLIAEHPFRDRLREHLMIALYRSGRIAAALDVYEETRRLYDDELGLTPGRQLQAIHLAILRADPCLELATEQAQ
jgi:DNA-binding SARP family transcriptional activator